MAEEEEETQDAGKTTAHAKGGVINLARIAGKTHLAGKLLEDALGGWGLSSAQDAGDCAWLLKAPSPLVLVMVVIPSWWRWQRRKAYGAL